MMGDSISFLPNAAELERLYECDAASVIPSALRKTLLDPLHDLLRRPRKELRAAAVRLGYKLANGDAFEPRSIARCSRFSDAVELLHMGSLIVDDIQDQSSHRRGDDALHVRYGVPVALNAGNWLYFWPFRIIDEMRLEPSLRLAAYDSMHRALLRAHGGQALDVGAPIDCVPQERVRALSVRSMELKSGALVSLAFELGALAAGAAFEGESFKRYGELGRRVGLLLQMRDDLGNLVSRKNPSKRFEDLVRRRPGFVWATAATALAPAAYDEFVALARALPASGAELGRFLERWEIASRGRIAAAAARAEAIELVESAWPERGGAGAEAAQLLDALTSAYD